MIGNPNTGKSTLFNALSGSRALTGNYPGVTVEKKISRMTCGDRAVDLIDLPGTYSLAPRTLDEMVAVNVLLGKQSDVRAPDVVICIVDASNIERNLYLVSQVLDMALPTIVVLNMCDVAAARGIQIDVPALSKRLGLPVIKTEAHRKRGLDELRSTIVSVAAVAPTHHLDRPPIFPAAFAAECEQLGAMLTSLGKPQTPYFLLERLLLDVGGYLEGHFVDGQASQLTAHLVGARERLAAQGVKVPAAEARLRYEWIRNILEGVLTRPASRPVTVSDKLDSFLTHRVAGLVVFALLMLGMFQAIYTGAKPLMELCDAGKDRVGNVVGGWLPAGMLNSLVVDGIIGGVGAVLVFLPQITLLFLFMAILEDCGYMARAAFLVDRLMTRLGLSGKSFVPLMSSFACAVPGILATRVIENRRDRMTTILVAPLMSCSARQPVYVLMATAFVPATTVLGGWQLPTLVVFGMTFLGALVAVPIAWLLKKTVFRGETPPFVMELPSYKWPSPGVIFNRVYEQAREFVVRAGTLIMATTVLIWGAGYFPGDHSRVDELTAQIEALQADPTRAEEHAEEIDDLVSQQNQMRGQLLEESYLGRFGHAIEPAVRPLGWDWRIGVGVMASFPAREVIVTTLGTIYSLGSSVEADDRNLVSAVQAARWPDGRPVYNVPVAVSIMVFFALCAQCASTLLVIRRETNSWRWPVFTFCYMTALAYLGALLAYQIGRLWS
ncbi:MAG: ferrous iron transport protein B [Planctomycetes bacterium]|nr:ferrous iron transport protein B [Planctomycetota bacterium]